VSRIAWRGRLAALTSLEPALGVALPGRTWRAASLATFLPSVLEETAKR
jgi:hypothetical protein